MIDYRELVIDELAAENAMLRDRTAGLETDVAVYREIACAAIDVLQALTVQNQRLECAARRARDEARSSREAALLAAGVDDGVIV